MTKPKGISDEPVPVDKANNLKLKVPMNGPERDRNICDLVSQGLVTNASNAMAFANGRFGELSLTAMVESLQASGEAINRNDLAAAERMLYAQAVTLNAIFNEMARRASLNMGERLDATDRYMRLGLKAQSQCRTTIEALHEMKNPRPVAFVQQANIAHGAQQVNNGTAPNINPTGAQAEKFGPAPNEQSGAGHELLEDTRASQGSGRANQSLAALETGNRAANGGG